jgi:hypothetical protein
MHEPDVILELVASLGWLNSARLMSAPPYDPRVIIDLLAEHQNEQFLSSFSPLE